MDNSPAFNRWLLISYLIHKSNRQDDSQSPLDGRLFAQGIEAEIPQADRREAEELERKARPRAAGMRPKNENDTEAPPSTS
jgi:hypothetical protein